MHILHPCSLKPLSQVTDNSNKASTKIVHSKLLP